MVAAKKALEEMREKLVEEEDAKQEALDEAKKMLEKANYLEGKNVNLNFEID